MIGWIIFFAIVVPYVIILLLHVVGCVRRRDFAASDKILWCVAMLIPIVGLVLYRGFGKEMYKRTPRMVSPKREGG